MKYANVSAETTVIHHTGRGHRLPPGRYEIAELDGTPPGELFLLDSSEGGALVCADAHDTNITVEPIMSDQLASEEQSARLARVRLEDELGTLRHAEQIARAHGNDHLANALYGFGCSLGSPDAQPPQVSRAIDALRLFGGDLSQEQAGALLEMWARRAELSPADVASVLDTVCTT